MTATVKRNAALQNLLDLSRQAVAANPLAGESAGAAADRIFDALQQPTSRSSSAEPNCLPACVHLDSALRIARKEGGLIGAIADALAELDPHLPWYLRPGTENDAGGLADRHANAYLCGPRGLEQREDAIAGMSLIAPNTRYPDHDHPPEEIYVVLSGGEWRQRQDPWHEPGPGGIVYNPPGILHAMRSGATPLLALWFLWPR